MSSRIVDGCFVLVIEGKAHPRPRQSHFVPWKQMRTAATAAFQALPAGNRAEAFRQFWDWLSSNINVKNYTPKDHPAVHYQRHIRLEARTGWPAPPSDSLIYHVDIQIVHKRPKAHYGTGRNEGKLKPNAPLWHSMKTGDNDNIEKAVWDALTGIIWADDSQVVSNSTQRRYARPGEPEMTVIRIGLVGDMTIEDRTAWADPYILDHAQAHQKPF